MLERGTGASHRDHPTHTRAALASGEPSRPCRYPEAESQRGGIHDAESRRGVPRDGIPRGGIPRRRVHGAGRSQPSSGIAIEHRRRRCQSTRNRFRPALDSGLESGPIDGPSSPPRRRTAASAVGEGSASGVPRSGVQDGWRNGVVGSPAIGARTGAESHVSRRADPVGVLGVDRGVGGTGPLTAAGCAPAPAESVGVYVFDQGAAKSFEADTVPEVSAAPTVMMNDRCRARARQEGSPFWA
jgi:hypothetical protein